MKELHILNLGAGVQSTAIAIMSHTRVAPKWIPVFDAAIFADTQEEPSEVYDHLQWLIEFVKPSFPVMIRTIGKLGDDLIRGRGGRVASIPAYTENKDDNTQGIIRRQCTAEYKVGVIEKTIRRELLGVEPRKRMPKDVVVHQYFGLSYDEPARIFGRGDRSGVKQRVEDKGFVPQFPLYDMMLTRTVLEDWLARQDIPHTVPRSACVFCPYKSDSEWLRLKNGDPEGWARAVEIDKALRSGDSVCAEGLHSALYLHKSRVPLDEAPLTSVEIRKSSLFDFVECEGMCGV